MNHQGVLGVILALVGLGLLGVGLYGVRKGRAIRRRGDRIAQVGTTTVDELQSGVVGLEGTARLAGDGGVVAGPISGDEAVVTHVEVARYADYSDGGSWKTFFEETEAVPFVLDDGTGEVLVDPPPEGAFELDLDHRRVGADEEPPASIRQFVEDQTGVSGADERDKGLLGGTESRRYSEGLVVPGEDVYVLGVVRERDDGSGYRVGGGVEPESFVLSDQSREDLRRQDRLGGSECTSSGESWPPWEWRWSPQRGC